MTNNESPRDPAADEAKLERGICPMHDEDVEICADDDVTECETLRNS